MFDMEIALDNNNMTTFQANNAGTVINIVWSG